jgi:hypothetical protein
MTMSRLWIAGVLSLVAIQIGCSKVEREHQDDQPQPLPEASTDLEQIARAFDDPRLDAEIQLGNALVEAVMADDVEGAREALAKGADVNARYVVPSFLSVGLNRYSPLLRASLQNNVELVKLLLEHNADPNLERKGRTALYLAATRGHRDVVKLLVEAGAQGDPRQIELTHELIRAACKGFVMGPGEGYPPYPGAVRDADDADEIDEVMARGADVNAADPEGFTPLMYAANLGLVDNVGRLLEHGADPSLQSASGETALSLVEGRSSVNEQERAEVARLLRQRAGDNR